MKVIDIADAIAPNCKKVCIGIRPGEKIHEQMISHEDSLFTFEYEDYYKILPQINDWSKDKARIKKGIKVPVDFVYSSELNKEWMSKSQLKEWISQNNKNFQ